MRYAHPIDFAQVRETIARVIQEATGLDQNQVIMAQAEEPDAPIPPYPFVTFQLTTAASYAGNDELRDVGAEGWALTGPRGALCSLDVFSDSHDEAYGLCSLLQAGLYTPTSQQLLRASNMAMWRCGDVVDLSLLLSTGFEGRARLDVRFGMSSALAVELEAIDQVSISGQVYTSPDPTEVTITVAPEE